ncbi:MAG: LLM class flavin-dependent oxidoreductase [Anaerolineaceae bacterium]|nr:LLM class flavin-dependent oxidoreductase [Anaerolineaceae bacterium]
MKYGFVLPKGDARTVAKMAALAERSGWDGFFVWEPIWGIDPWVSLAAAAMVTTSIRLGTMLTPISIRKPWKLASETATLDNLSNGRLILSVGLGAVDTGFANFGEQIDRKIRAELVDEGLNILTGLWNGQPFTYEGKHYQIKETGFYPPPPPLQQPRIPIWVVGAWKREKSLARALRYDGLLPDVMTPEGEHRRATPDEVGEIRAYIIANRTDTGPYDIVVEGETPADDPVKAREQVHPWNEAGATWWIEASWTIIDDPDCAEKLQQRIQAGPPR